MVVETIFTPVAFDLMVALGEKMKLVRAQQNLHEIEPKQIRYWKPLGNWAVTPTPNPQPPLADRKQTGRAEGKLGSRITGVDLVREHDRRNPLRVETQSPAGIL